MIVDPCRARRWLWPAVLFALAGAASPAWAQSARRPDTSSARGQSILPHFAQPPRAYSPVPIWWWSGERLTLRRLEWQLDQMVRGHVYNTVILNLAPSGGLYGSQPDSPAFFTPQWWITLRRVLARAKQLGVRVWLYDQLGFSTARIQERLMAREPAWRAVDLRVVEREVVGPATVRLSAPGKALAASALRLDAEGKPDGTVANLQTSISDGYLTKQMPSGRWLVLLYHEAPAGFDYMNPVAAGRLINFVHGEYARKLGPYLGSTVPGTFQDELPPMNRWTRGFLETFRKRKGYDLRPLLPMLWRRLGPKTTQVRCDVADVQSQLLEEAFFRPLFRWHRERNMICSYDQMTRDADPMSANSMYVDYMRTMRWFQAPGNDQTGVTRPHSSLAHLYKRPRVWLEGFYNSGWGQTLEELAARVHDFYAEGANLYNPHAWYYSTLAGWWEWAPPCTSFRQPYYAHYALFSDHVTRLSYALSQGRHVCDIAVLHPSATIHAGTPIGGRPESSAQAARDAYWDICRALDAEGIDYDIIDEASLAAARVDGGALRAADESYRAVLLPAATTLGVAHAARLRSLMQSGGVVGALRALPRGSAEGGDGDPRVAIAPGEMGTEPAWTRRTGKGTLLFEPSDAARLVRAVAARYPRHVTGDVRYLHRRVADAEVYFLVSGSSAPVDLTFVGSGRVSVWCPWTGSVRPLAARPDGPGRLAARVSFADSRAVIVTAQAGSAPAVGPRPPRTVAASATAPSLRPARASAPPSRSSAEPPPITIDGPWDGELVPTLDNRWGDFARPASTGPLPVECRTFRYREEGEAQSGVALGWHESRTPDAGWSRVTATFGPYWWVTRDGIGDRALKLPGPSESDWRPNPEVWQPAVFSLKYGIEKDPVYGQWLGPKGRVPNEYLVFGSAPAGTVRFAVTFVHVPRETPVVFSCGQGDARVALNSRWLPAGPKPRAVLLEGYNAIAVQFRHPVEGPLQTYVHIGPAAETEAAPNWIWTPTGATIGDCFARRVFDLDTRPARAVISVTADNGYELYVNAKRVGRDVGPESSVWSSAERYDVTSLLHKGRNVIAIHGMNLGGPAGLIAVLSASPGRAPMRAVLATDATWRVSTRAPAGWTSVGFAEGSWVAATVIAPYPSEPWGAVEGLVRAEPSVLPESDWLNGSVKPWAQGLIMDPRPGIGKRVGWYRFAIPPGAMDMKLPFVGPFRVFVDGIECAVGSNDTVEIPPDAQLSGGTCAVRVEQAAGRYGGAALRAPVTFTVGPGSYPPGPWADLGLPHYSGGVRYTREVDVTAAHAAAALVLDLGRVRGTAELRVNDKPAGVRMWRPYRFDVTGLLKTGRNTITVTVYNTLAPYFDVGYPTPYVFPGQTVSGMMGPVRIWSGRTAPAAPVDLNGLTNVALAGLGATVRASSEHASGRYLADSVIAGDVSGDRWASGGGWNDGTEGEFPDWIEVTLAEPALVRAVRVVTLAPADRWGVRDLDVEVWRGGQWRKVADVRDNADRSVLVAVPSITTDRVRVVVHGSNDDAYSRIVALEVYAGASGSER